MKKALLFLLILATLFSIASCKEGLEESLPPLTETETETVKEIEPETKEEAKIETEADTEAEAVPETEAETEKETEVPTEKETEKETEVPTEKETEKETVPQNEKPVSKVKDYEAEIKFCQDLNEQYHNVNEDLGIYKISLYLGDIEYEIQNLQFIICEHGCPEKCIADAHKSGEFSEYTLNEIPKTSLFQLKGKAEIEAPKNVYLCLYATRNTTHPNKTYVYFELKIKENDISKTSPDELWSRIKNAQTSEADLSDTARKIISCREWHVPFPLPARILYADPSLKIKTISLPEGKGFGFMQDGTYFDIYSVCDKAYVDKDGTEHPASNFCLGFFDIAKGEFAAIIPLIYDKPYPGIAPSIGKIGDTVYICTDDLTGRWELKYKDGQLIGELAPNKDIDGMSRSSVDSSDIYKLVYGIDELPEQHYEYPKDEYPCIKTKDYYLEIPGEALWLSTMYQRYYPLRVYTVDRSKLLAEIMFSSIYEIGVSADGTILIR
ncbi:MAG: hypothetical protein E7623_03680 [Ruminococcaceae bacterium]|nr:hypothetical protein [Oscillospiraceae bacterium]